MDIIAIYRTFHPETAQYYIGCMGFPGGSDSIVHLWCWRPRLGRFDSWGGKIPWGREWLPTPILLPGEFHGQRAWRATVHGVTELDTIEQLIHTHIRCMNVNKQYILFLYWSLYCIMPFLVFCHRLLFKVFFFCCQYCHPSILFGSVCVEKLFPSPHFHSLCVFSSEVSFL